MLCATELTKKTLQMECEEARFALKPWPIESTVLRQLDKNTCTCEEVIITSEEKAEEIAAEIGKTLLHSQQLREKLAINLHKERQNARKPDIRQIYSSSSNVSKRPPKPSPAVSKSNVVDKENSPRPRRSMSQQRPSSSESRKSSASRKRSTSMIRDEVSGKMTGRRMGVYSKVLVEPSRDNILAQMTSAKPKPQPNFILANKLSVRGAKQSTERTEIRQRSKSQVDLRRVGLSTKPATKTDKSTSTYTRNDEVETISELDRLIKKFASTTQLNSSQVRNNCPIHADDAPTTFEEKVVTMVDAVEGLDRFGVPAQLIKILKVYHAYVRAEVFDETPAVSKKQQDAAGNFLTNFDRVSKKKKFPHLNISYQETLNGFSAICHGSLRPDLSTREIKVLKAKFVSVEPKYNECNIKATAGEMQFVRTNSNELDNEIKFDMKNWISNGIWNYLCVSDLKGIFGSHCTRYSDRNQLMLFYNLIQKIQRKVYETELMEVLLMTVIPMMKEFFDPNSKEFTDMYKMIITVAQVINPRVPVLAKTED